MAWLGVDLGSSPDAVRVCGTRTDFESMYSSHVRLLALDLSYVSDGLIVGRGALSLAGNRLTKAAMELKQQAGAAEEMRELEALKSELHDKDAALEMAKHAMKGLSKLTEKLIGEAAAL